MASGERAAAGQSEVTGGRPSNPDCACWIEYPGARRFRCDHCTRRDIADAQAIVAAFRRGLTDGR